MLKTKEELVRKINQLCNGIIGTPSIMSEKINLLNTKYGIPMSLSNSILSMRVDAIDENEFILYCVLDVLDNKYVNKYFTEKEINAYSVAKFKAKKVKFPIRLRMIQTGDDSWIGSIKVNQLMMFRDAQLINYNENTQRTLDRIISGGVEHFQISLNRFAVDAIAESFKENRYIPNTITLNMPEDTEFDYDGDELVIKSLSAFDIIDGYHRYVAMSNVYSMNKKFDYTMELRIVCFSEEKAKQFIWQEDQKTKMTKVDSDSFNQSNPANQVVQMLNQKGIFNGLITRNKAIIDAAEMGRQISILYFATNKKYTRSNIIKVRDEIYRRLNAIVDTDISIIDKRWNTKFLICAMYCISNTEIDDEELLNSIKKLYEELSKKENENVISPTMSKANYTRIGKIYEGLEK